MGLMCSRETPSHTKMRCCDETGTEVWRAYETRNCMHIKAQAACRRKIVQNNHDALNGKRPISDKLNSRTATVCLEKVNITLHIPRDRAAPSARHHL
ncbi:hypothetical protein M3J09_009289 [Ascochyta lentis]